MARVRMAAPRGQVKGGPTADICLVVDGQWQFEFIAGRRGK